MNLLVVDEQPIVVTACRALFEADGGMTVCGAQSAAAARAMIRKSDPDVAIIDPNLRDASGFEFIRELSTEIPSLNILVFSTANEQWIADQALELGAKAFVSKLWEVDHLKTAVLTVARGKVWFHKNAEASFWNCNHKADLNSPFSGREHEVLRQLSDGRSTEDIAATLGVSCSTISRLCRSLRDKFKARNLLDLVRITAELKLVR